TEVANFINGALEEILGALQVSDAGSDPVELSALDDAVTCTMGGGRLVEVRLPGRISSVSEECTDTFLDYLKPVTLRIAVELENHNRFPWLKQVLERNNVVELRVRLGCSDAERASRALIDYLAVFDEESEGQTKGKLESDSPSSSSSLQTLAFENGIVDIPHLLRMVASRVNGRRDASTRIQQITLVNCGTSQRPDLSPAFRDLGADLIVR
ncbi:hypothetical protein FRC01_013353, partial [Tulasnella sp. 417]